MAVEDNRHVLDQWLPRVAQVATVLSFGMVVFGYFYVVRPVFQYANLQEKAASLESANRLAEQKLAATAEAQATGEAKVASLRAELSKISRDRDALSSRLITENNREILAMKMLLSVRGELTAEKSKLLEAQRRILYSRFVFSRLRVSASALAKSWNKTEADGEDGEFIVNERADWPNPYLTLSGMLDYVKDMNVKSHEVPDDLISPLRGILDAHRAELACDIPDLESLRQSYMTDLMQAHSAAIQDATENLNKQLADAKAKKVTLLVTDEFRAQMAKDYEIGRIFALKERYKTRINEFEKDCSEKAEPVVQLINKNILSGLPE